MDILRIEIIIGMIGSLKCGTRGTSRSILPEDLSASYKCIVKRDFSGSVEDSARQGNDDSVLMKTGVVDNMLDYFYRQQAIERNMIEETITLPWNLSKLGWYCNDFLHRLATHMGWDDLIQKCSRRGVFDWAGTDLEQRNYSINVLIGDRIFGELDSEQSHAKCRESKKCADFVQTYFESFTLDNISFS